VAKGDRKATAFENHTCAKRKPIAKQEKNENQGKARRVHLHDVPDPQENVLICDNAADQCIIGQGFKVLFYTGQLVQMDGAMAGMKGERYPIVCAAAMVEDGTSEESKIIIVNQAAYNKDTKQHESLLHTEQARMHGVKVNDLSSFMKDGHGFNGKQNLETEGITLPLLYDGSKYFLKVREPTEKELESLPTYELTSPMPWQPREQLGTLRRNKRNFDCLTTDELEDWSKRLGIVPIDVVKKTLEATTQLINSTEAESRTTPR
jgi:hypothetical protein